jgi:hypothetical protein
MDLLIAVGVVLIYVVVAATLMVRTHRFASARALSRAWRMTAPLVVLLVALAIPFGDHLVGWLYFRYLCEREAGERIYRTVDGVEGVRWMWPLADRDTARELGYLFVETGRNLNSLTR